jgi:dTDP-4-amino-4,6-dideoxygalactose transaminase
LPVTDAALERCLSLPTGTAVDPDDVAGIGQIVQLAVASAAAVGRQLED